MTEEQKSEIMLLRRQGAGYKRIAAIMEISVETVNRIAGEILRKML